jgi:hypothetical protein
MPKTAPNARPTAATMLSGWGAPVRQQLEAHYAVHKLGWPNVKKVHTIHRYIEEQRDRSRVLDWIRGNEAQTEEVQLQRGVLVHFKECGPLIIGDDGSVDPGRSPVALILAPRVRRGILWTVGEVHFLTTPLRQSYPTLHRLSRALNKWLRQYECVFANGNCPCPEWEYQLEGSVRNWDAPIFALPSGLAALRSGS